MNRNEFMRIYANLCEFIKCGRYWKTSSTFWPTFGKWFQSVLAFSGKFRQICGEQQINYASKTSFFSVSFELLSSSVFLLYHRTAAARARRRPPAEFRWKRLKQFSLEVLLEKNTALRACRRECRLILQKRYVRDDAEVRKSCRSHDMMQYE